MSAKSKIKIIAEHPEFGILNLDDFNINQLFKYDNNWHGSCLLENEAKYHYEFNKESLALLEETFLKGNSTKNYNIHLDSNNLNRLSDSKLTEIVDDQEYKDNLFKFIIKRIEDDKKLLINLIQSKNHAEIIEKNFDNLFKLINERESTETDYNCIGKINLPEEIRNTHLRPNSFNFLENDVKVWFGEEEEQPQDRDRDHIFSYISEQFNSDPIDSNIFYYNTNFSAVPISSLNEGDENFPAITFNDFLSNKRKRIEGELINENDDRVHDKNIFEEREIKSKEDLLDEERGELVKEYFYDKHSYFIRKWFTKSCLNCGEILKIRKIEVMCCDTYICKNCVAKYFTFISELFKDFKSKKYKSDKCILLNFNIFYCNYCFVLDDKKNLKCCTSHLCMNLHHEKCAKFVRIINNPNSRLSYNKNLLEKITYEVIKIIDASLIKNKSKNKLVNSDDKSFLLNQMDNGKVIMALYKINTSSFYMLFIKSFVEYIISNESQLFNSNIGINHKEASDVCFRHICISCLSDINDLDTSPSLILSDIDNLVSEVCCSRMHNRCYNKTNDNLIFVLHNQNSHIPLLHFKFVYEVYINTKKLSINCNLKDILANATGIVNKFEYKLLSKNEMNKVKSCYKEISNNINTKLIKKLKNKKAIKEKCECYKKVVKLTNTNNQTKNKTNTNLRSSKQIKELFTDTEFMSILKSCGERYCDKSCGNYSMKIECFDETCELPEELCSNRFNSNNGKYYNDLEIVQTERKGYGLICQKDIKKGEYIAEYIGNIVNTAEMTHMINLKNKSHGWYLMGIEKNLYIDAYKYGNKARFINHSCEPNCIVEKWIGKNFYPRLLIMSDKDIPAGTEITYNYNFNYFKNDEELSCHCGSKTCLKRLKAANNSISKFENFDSINTVVISNNYNKIMIDKSYLILPTKASPIVDFINQKKLNFSFSDMNKKSILKSNKNLNNVLLNKNIILVKKKIRKDFFNNNKIFFLKNCYFQKFIKNSFIQKENCRICKLITNYKNFKHCESCGNPYHQSCLNIKLLEFEKSNIKIVKFKCNECLDLEKINLVNKNNITTEGDKFQIQNQILEKYRNELSEKLKTISVKDEKKIIKILTYSKPVNEVSHSCLVISNTNINSAIFYEHLNDQNNFNKILKKFVMMEEKGEAKSFLKKAEIVFVEFIREILNL